jgi:hypothetical protein
LRRLTLVACAVLAARTDGAAQTPRPPIGFAYTASQFDCARFVERSRGTLDAETGLARRHETLRRDAVWLMRAQPAPEGTASGALTIEAWLDSLSLAREGPEGTRAPDTDGLLGGRYRGTLTAAGRYTATARPFVPDEVAEVAELGAAMDDLLPPLPPVALAVGQRWEDSSGLELRRLPDSTAGHRVLRRLGLRSRTQADRADIRGDTTPVPATQRVEEDGIIEWEAGRGLVRRVRHIVVETSVPAGGAVRRALRSRLAQDVMLVRTAGGCAKSP